MSSGAASSESVSYTQAGGTVWDSNDMFNASNYKRAVGFFGLKSQQVKDWYGKTQMYQMDSSQFETPEQSTLAESLGRAQGRQSTDNNIYGLESLAQPSGPSLGGK